MKRVFLILALLPFTVFAGKMERDYNTKELIPSVNAAEAAYQTACGCGLKIAIAANVTSKNDLWLAKNVADDVKKGVTKYCTDAASKAAVCKMTTLAISKGAKTKFTFGSGKGLAEIDNSSYPGWAMMTPQLDK